MIQLEFSRRYSMAHRLLSDRTSKCAIPHGHNEIVTVRLGTDLPLEFGERNLVAPFDVLKRRWMRWIDDAVDHSFHISLRDPLIEHFTTAESDLQTRLMTFDGDPTTEALAMAFAMKLSAFLHAAEMPFRCEQVTVEETPTNKVVLERAWDLSACGAWTPGQWAGRADMSINDLPPRRESAKVGSVEAAVLSQVDGGHRGQEY